MFPSLAAHETCVAETNFAAPWQNIFFCIASQTQILSPKRMFSSLGHNGNNVIIIIIIIIYLPLSITKIKKIQHVGC